MWENIQKKFLSLAIRLWLPIYWQGQGLLVGLFTRRARPLRFICTGGIAGLIQIYVLVMLVRYGWEEMIANVLAFVLSAQVNFLVSFFFTWYDREPVGAKKKAFLSRWLIFHSSIVTTAVLNQIVFIIARIIGVPTLFASCLGIASAALVNFIILNQFVFRSEPMHVDVQADKTDKTPVSGIVDKVSEGDR